MKRKLISAVLAASVLTGCMSGLPAAVAADNDEVQSFTDETEENGISVYEAEAPDTDEAEYDTSALDMIDIEFDEDAAAETEVTDYEAVALDAGDPVELSELSARTWDLTALEGKIDGFDAEAFIGGAEYSYEDLTIKGGSGAEIGGDGVKFLKSTNNKDMYIKYTPSENGTLSVTAKIGKSGSYYGDVYVGTSFVKANDTEIIKSSTANAVVTASIKLTAGSTYYIYNGNSGPSYMQSLEFASDGGSDEPVQTQQPQETEEPKKTDEPAEEIISKPTNDPSVTLPPIGNYEPDFVFADDYQNSESGDDLGGWIAHSGGLTLTEDSDGNRYINMKHSASGGRGAYLLMNSEVDEITHYTMEFDAKFRNGSKSTSQLALGAADYLMTPSSGNTDYEGDPLDQKRYDYNKGMESNYILLLEGTANSKKWTLNRDTDNKEWTINTGEWLHFEIEGCVPTNQVYLKVTNGDTVVYDGQITPHSDYAAPQMLYLLGGREYPDIGIDNIDLKAYYSISPLSVYKDGSEVGISLPPFNEGTSVYAALYNADGALGRVSVVNGDGKTAKTLKIDTSGTAGNTIKLYKWDGDMKPLTDTNEININEIKPAESLMMADMRYAYHDAAVSLDGETEYKDVMPYRYYLPQSYDSTKKYPIVIYLHGAGARGEDNKGQIRNDRHLFETLLGEEFINAPDYQCIMIAPQVPRYDDNANRYINRGWAAGSYNYDEVTPYEYVKHVHDVIEEVVETYNGDRDRIYLSGESMGGYGSWYLAATYPEMFAAAVVLCGAGPIDANGAGKIAEQNMAVWAFHGDKDVTVPYKVGSKPMIEAIRSFGATNAHLTTMPGYGHEIDHDVFTLIGKAQGLYPWLFAQSRTKNLANKGGETEPDAPYPDVEATAQPTAAPTATPEPTKEPETETNAELYAIYTLDGTADGEIGRIKAVSGNDGDSVSVPASAFGARKFTDADGLYDIYTYVSGGTEPVTLKEGENTVYITVKHEDGKYYYWEDFEGYEAGDIPSDNQWHHGGAGTVSSFINCTTDTANTTTSARWYSSNTSGSRSKTFSIFSGVPSVPEGEKLVFSADLRVGITNGNTTKLSIGNSDEQMFLMALKNSMETTVNDTDTVKLPSVTGSGTEAGGSRTLSKWFNLNITVDPSAASQNTTVTLTPLTAGDQLTVNGEKKDSYSYTTDLTVNAVTRMGVELCKGYFGAVIADNIKLYNTQSEYLTPAMNELQQAVNMYGDIDKSLYTSRGMSEYDTAAAAARSVLADSSSTNKAAKDAKNALVNAASALELVSVQDNDRTVINENPDWIFIKEKNYQSDTDKIMSAAPEELALSGWESVDVPHTWNAYDGSDGVQGYDTCKSWYRKSMYVDSAYEGKKVYLEFEGASIRTELYINGVHVPFSYNDPFGTAVNGVEYEHKGGFNTFRFDVTDYVNYGESNNVAVSVDNRLRADTLPLGGDYSREGGIYRNVSLVVTDPVHVDMLDDGSSGIYLLTTKKTDVADDANKDFTLKASAKIVNDSDTDKEIKIEAVLREPDHYDVPDNEYIKNHLQFDPRDMYTEGGKTVGEFAAKTVTVKAGESYDYTDTIDVTEPKLWDGITSPYRYEVNLKVTADGAEAENLTETVGFRYYRVPLPTGANSGGGFYLNGRAYPIKGVGKHQDWSRKEDALGIATTEREMLSDVANIYELGANSVRLVHYQHSLHEIELYDKLGITVWSEPALCSSMTNASQPSYDAFEKATLYQFSAMIKQQYNKPSVLFWCFSNELTHERDENCNQISRLDGVVIEGKFPSAVALFEKMQERAKELDPSRQTTYAANKRRHEGDLGTDLTGSNVYPYWYVSSNMTSAYRNALNALKDLMGGKYKPLCISETGGAAVVGRTLEYNADGTVDFLGTATNTYTSNTTYQAFMHEKIWYEYKNSCKSSWGIYLWQMFDSANDTVDINLGGVNTKGLIAYDHTTRKASYYFYKANWNEYDPFVYMVNQERSVRPSDKTIIRAYSNAEKCQLYVNGEKYGEAITDTYTNDKVYDNNHVFMWYDVSLDPDAVNTIEIRGINGSSEICSTKEVNGDIAFTVDGTLLTSEDSSVIEIEGATGLVPGDNLIKVRTMAADAPEIADITGKRLVKPSLDSSQVTVSDSADDPVTEGRLYEGMTVRVTDANGNNADYKVVYEDLAQGRLKGADAVLTDGSTVQRRTLTDESIVIDLGAEYNINGFDLIFDEAVPYRVKISSDNSSYTEVTSRSGPDAVSSDKLIESVSARYVKLEFTGAPSLKEINVYGWRFNNKGSYTIDGNDIYLGLSDSEHDTDEVNNNLPIVGQASYDFELAEAGRVLSEGDKLIVTETHGKTIEYILHMGSK